MFKCAFLEKNARRGTDGNVMEEGTGKKDREVLKRGCLNSNDVQDCEWWRAGK